MQEFILEDGKKILFGSFQAAANILSDRSNSVTVAVLPVIRLGREEEPRLVVLHDGSLASVALQVEEQFDVEYSKPNYQAAALRAWREHLTDLSAAPADFLERGVALANAYVVAIPNEQKALDVQVIVPMGLMDVQDATRFSGALITFNDLVTKLSPVMAAVVGQIMQQSYRGLSMENFYRHLAGSQLYSDGARFMGRPIVPLASPKAAAAQPWLGGSGTV